MWSLQAPLSHGRGDPPPGGTGSAKPPAGPTRPGTALSCSRRLPASLGRGSEIRELKHCKISHMLLWALKTHSLYPQCDISSSTVYIQFDSESQLCPPAGSRLGAPGVDPPRGLRATPPALGTCSQPSRPRGEGRRLGPGLRSGREAGGPRAARHPSRPGRPQGREAGGVSTAGQQAGVWERLGGQERDSLRNYKSRSLEGKDARNAHGPWRRPWKLGRVPSPAPAGCTRHTFCVFFFLSCLSLSC